MRLSYNHQVFLFFVWWVYSVETKVKMVGIKPVGIAASNPV